MKSYVNDIVVTDPNGEKAILYPNTKQEAVAGLIERFVNVEKPDITETTETTMPNSFDGRFLFKKIKGVGEQGENPSPENPQEIKNSVVSKIKTHGKNWIPYPYDMTTTTSAGMTFTDNEDGTIDVVGTATANTGFNCQSRIDTETPFILPKGTYRLTGCPSGGGSGKYLLMIQKTDPETGSALNFGSDSGSGVTVTLEEDCETMQINIFIYSGFSTTAPIVFKPMLVRVDDTGNTDNTWEPYKESVVTLSQPIELSDSDKIINTENGFVLSIGETTEALPTADQLALNSLKTFEGITYLEFDSEIKPEFEGEYGTSKVGAYTLESLLTARNNDIRISSVEATVVNNI